MPHNNVVVLMLYDATPSFKSMLEQFVVVHYSGIILWRNQQLQDLKALNDIITQVLIENRQIGQPKEIGDQHYYFEVIDELQLIMIGSLPKQISVMSMPEIIKGLAISFIQEYEIQIRACVVDLDLDVFSSFDPIYQRNLASLVRNGKICDEKEAECNAADGSTGNTQQPAVQCNDGHDEYPGESVKERMKRLQEEARRQKQHNIQQRQLQHQQNTQKEQKKRPQPVEKKSERVGDEDKYSYIDEDRDEKDANLFSSNAQSLKQLLQQSKKTEQTGFWASLTTKVLDQSTVGKMIGQIRQEMLDSNVSSEIVDQLLQQINAEELQGSSFKSAKSIVRACVKQQVEKIIQTDSSNLLSAALDRAQQRARGLEIRPFVICIVGINGMGKTTTIAKLLYKFTKAGLRCFACGCDSFRSGAIEQLGTHCKRLNCDMYSQGYGKKPSSIARYGIEEATKKNADVVFIDTAGRMQNNSALMQELSKLVKENKPDRVVYVGEALVGSTGVVQLKEFDSQLRSQAGVGIDGVVLSKFDTIGDKVGTALNFCYGSGVPIYFVGIGQSYPDLGEIEVEDLVELIV